MSQLEDILAARARYTRNARWFGCGFAGAAVLFVLLLLALPTQRAYLLHGAPEHDAVIADARPASVDSCKGAVMKEYDVVVEWRRGGESVRGHGSWCAEDPPRVGSAQRVWQRSDGTVAKDSPKAFRITIGVVVAFWLAIGAFGSWAWLGYRPPLPPDALSRT